MTYLVLTEGGDDAHFVSSLLRASLITSRVESTDIAMLDETTIYIRGFGGYSEIVKGLPIRLKSPGNVDKLALIVDADESAETRWNELRSILLAFGYDQNVIPVKPNAGGTIINDVNMAIPVIGVWIMPNNVQPGALEQFMKFLVPAGDSLWEHARNTVDQLPDQRFAAKDFSKAHVRTWLAWQTEPGASPGLAITSGYLDKQEVHAQQLVQWIRNVFAV